MITKVMSDWFKGGEHFRGGHFKGFAGFTWNFIVCLSFSTVLQDLANIGWIKWQDCKSDFGPSHQISKPTCVRFSRFARDD